MAANFQLSDDTVKKQLAAQAEQDRIKALQANRESFGPGQGLPTPDELMRHNALEQSKWNAEAAEQASRGGVDVASATANAGGIAGFFGGKEETQHFTAGRVEDPNMQRNQARIAAEIAGINRRPDQQLAGAQMARTDAPWVRGQADLARQLAMASQGFGPSAAQAQLQMGTDQARAAAMSLARSGRAGGSGAAMKQALMQQGQLSQQAVNQAAMLRAQETAQARGQLAGVLEGARGQEIGVQQAQAGLTMDAQKANLAAAMQQQQHRDEMVAKLMGQGFSLEQAQRQAEIQQSQFNAELLARQVAADKGVAMQSSAQAGQAMGQTAAAIAALLAA
jgi:lambda repressor-like predicted transcriptional regulator